MWNQADAEQLSDGVAPQSKQGTIDLIGKTLDFEDVRTVDSSVSSGNTLTQAWEANVGGRPVRGVGIIDVVKGNEMWQIRKWNTEFDNLSYQRGLGA